MPTTAERIAELEAELARLRERCERLRQVAVAHLDPDARPGGRGYHRRRQALDALHEGDTDPPYRDRRPGERGIESRAPGREPGSGGDAE